MDNLNPSFAEVARALGAHGLTVSRRAELDGALREALACDGPVVVDVHVEPEENVFPMVAAGKALHEMKLGKLA